MIAEDGVLLREGLVGLLERFGYAVTAAVGDAPALLSTVDADPPDLVLTDVRMPPGNADDGLRDAVQLCGRHPKLPLLVLSQYVEQTYATELLDSGDAGTGYLLKNRIADVADFVDAVGRVLAGGTVVDPQVVRQRLRRRRDSIDRLSPREREVLALMAEGRFNAAIAKTLYVTDAAVSKHIRSIFTKLDLPPADTDHRRVLAVLAWLRR
ncbi:Transcriptional regulatory protein DegU [Streptomyces sp. RB17]|uniref:response regulator transcription factor n=1 Tax=Streptomyces sp. RB17 TaxID=2585197 RepID=UPI00130A3D51|nr:response regulator transcription factor [Streptomyces sp. RB17]MQY40353.1 Transcriptional regulatory protein DegU [Streptomyces sp. RB17]